MISAIIESERDKPRAGGERLRARRMSAKEFRKEGTHMKKAVMYGGGNIGRGFIGKVFSDSGYEVCFPGHHAAPD